MKKILLSLSVLACLMSCEKIDVTDEGNTSNNTRNIQFVIKGIDVSYGTTRTTLASENMTDLYVWEGTTLLAHQISTDADFGIPTVSLSIGAHDLTFVASKSTGQNWSDGVWSCTKVNDTFGTVLSYTVSGNSSSKQVQLTRVNGKLQWTIEDAVPANVTTVSFSVPQCFGLDASLNGVNASTYTASGDITAKQGQTGYAPFLMVIPADHANGSTISPTISFNDGTSYTTECSIKPNIVTNIHGSFFSGSVGTSVSLSTDWGTQNDIDLR